MKTSSSMGLTIFWAKKFPFCLRCFEFLSLSTITYTIRCLQKVHILLGTGLFNLMKVYWRRIWTRVCFSSYIDNYCLAVCRFFRSKCNTRRYSKFEINDILFWNGALGKQTEIPMTNQSTSQNQLLIICWVLRNVTWIGRLQDKKGHGHYCQEAHCLLVKYEPEITSATR